MSLASAILPEFDHEMTTTRRVLEQVPQGHFEWRPHPKARAMGALAAHVAGIPHLAVSIIQQESLDVAPPGTGPNPTREAKTPVELIAQFDRNAAAAREAISTAGDTVLMTTWTLLNGGHTVFTMPRVAALRFVVMNHLIHHRGQLSFYFRLADLPVPAVYGPPGS